MTRLIVLVLYVRNNMKLLVTGPVICFSLRQGSAIRVKEKQTLPFYLFCRIYIDRFNIRKVCFSFI